MTKFQEEEEERPLTGIDRVGRSGSVDYKFDPDEIQFSCSIRHLTPNVINQKCEDTCFAVQATEAISTVHKIWGINVNLSPQVLIDADCDTSAKANSYVATISGLQRLEDYQYTRIKEDDGDDEPRYQEGERYRIDGFKTREHDIKYYILFNFHPELGPHYPLIGGMRLGALKMHKMALHAYHYRPFSHPQDPAYMRKLEKESDHCLLIVGVDTTSEDPQRHCCLVKNSWGPNYGFRGFTKVCFDVFYDVDIPRYNDSFFEKFLQQ